MQGSKFDLLVTISPLPFIIKVIFFEYVIEELDCEKVSKMSIRVSSDCHRQLDS